MEALTKSEARKRKAEIKKRQAQVIIDEELRQKGFRLIANGELRLGYQKLFESNEDRKRIIGTYRFKELEYWDGGKAKLLVYFDGEGIGIQLLAAFMLSRMADSLEEITFLCEERLLPVLRRTYPEMEFIPISEIDKLEETISSDYKVALTKTVLYHSLDKGNKDGSPLKISKKVPVISNRIGVSWKTSNDREGEQKRNLSLKKLRPLLETEGIEFISVQHDVTEKERVQLEKLNVATPDYQSIDDYLDMISSCSSIISVDNSAAIMAGLMNKDVICLLCKKHIWLYPQVSDVSPWSPSVSLMRGIDTDWEKILESIKENLECG